MVYMSNQTTNVSTGRYAPQVHYNQQAPQPINQRLTSKVKEPSVDWTSVAVEAIGGITENMAKARQADAALAQQGALNDLAREANNITESQRQGVISSSQAATAFRALKDRGIAGGLSEKDVSETVGRYDGGLLTIDQERQNMIMKNDQKYWEDQAADLASKHGALQRMEPSKRTALLMGMRTLVDDINSYKHYLGTLPEGEEKNIAKAHYEHLLTKNNYANFAAMAGDMFAQNKPITDEQVFVLRQQVVNAGIANGLDPASAGIIADEIINSYGLRDGTSALKAFYKDSTEMMEAGNKFVLASATQRMLSMQEASWIMALPEPLQNHVLTKNFGKVNNMLVNYLGGVKTNSTTGEYELADVNSLTEEDLVTVGHVAKNMNSSSMYNNAVRSRAEAIFLSRFNIAQNLTATSSDADAQTVAMNVDGALKFVNLDLATQHANEMKNSNDPTEAEIGALLEQEVNKTVQQKDLSQKIPVARRIAKDMVNLNKNPELSRATNSVFKSSNVGALRFTEDGELFVSRLADESAIDLFAGAGTEDLKAVNDYLKGLDPEMRKLVLQQKGVQAAEVGDAPYVVDTSKSLTENLLDASSTPEEIAQRAETKRIENEKMSAIEAEYKGKIKTGDYWEKRRKAQAESLGEPYDLLDLPKDIANGIKSLFGIKDAKAEEEIAKLQETLKDDDLKPHIRRAVEGTIKVLENRTASATTKSSETLANAKLSTDDLSIWDDVEAASAADTRAAQGLSEYDTDLGASGEAHYQEWKKSLPEQLQADTDYDLRGYYQDTNGGEAEGHLTDVYKKPNHPTFSKESKYYKKGMWAGEWTEDGDFKIPLNTPKEKLRELVEYWRSGAEPSANLIVDNPKAEKEIDKLENRLAKYTAQLNSKNESEDAKRLIRKEVTKLRKQISDLYRLIYVNTAGE